MEEYLTVPELARRLRLNAYTVRKWIKSGLLEAEIIQEGKRRRYRIQKYALDRMMRYNER